MNFADVYRHSVTVYDDVNHSKIFMMNIMTTIYRFQLQFLSGIKVGNKEKKISINQVVISVDLVRLTWASSARATLRNETSGRVKSIQQCIRARKYLPIFDTHECHIHLRRGRIFIKFPGKLIKHLEKIKQQVKQPKSEGRSLNWKFRDIFGLSKCPTALRQASL